MSILTARQMPEMAAHFDQSVKFACPVALHTIAGENANGDVRTFENGPPDHNKNPLDSIKAKLNRGKAVEALDDALDLLEQDDLPETLRMEVLELAVNAFNSDFYDMPAADKRRLYWDLLRQFDDEEMDFGSPVPRAA